MWCVGSGSHKAMRDLYSGRMRGGRGRRRRACRYLDGGEGPPARMAASLLRAPSVHGHALAALWGRAKCDADATFGDDVCLGNAASPRTRAFFAAAVELADAYDNWVSQALQHRVASLWDDDEVCEAFCALDPALFRTADLTARVPLPGASHKSAGSDDNASGQPHDAMRADTRTATRCVSRVMPRTWRSTRIACGRMVSAQSSASRCSPTIAAFASRPSSPAHAPSATSPTRS